MKISRKIEQSLQRNGLPIFAKIFYLCTQYEDTMETRKVNFNECDRIFLEDTFGLVQIQKSDLLNNWIGSGEFHQNDDSEKKILIRLQDTLSYRVDDWNEQELIENFISPLFSIVNFNTLEYGMFSERLLKATIGEYELSGYPDAIVAKGRRYPKIPYFCFHEYKKENEPKGDPAGQCLVAMLVAQELNIDQKPIYGVYVVGRNWFFLVLCGKEYAISKGHNALEDDIYEIVKLLKHLKTIIDEFVKN